MDEERTAGDWPDEVRFRPGDAVIHIHSDGVQGVVTSMAPIQHAGEWWLEVNYAGALKKTREDELQAVEAVPTFESLLCSGPFLGPGALRRRATMLQLHSKLKDTVYSYGAARTQLWTFFARYRTTHKITGHV